MIDAFLGQHAFLSNFFQFDGELSVEHYYQAEKTLDPVKRKEIMDAPTAAQAKRLGRKVPLRQGWENMKLNVMQELLEWKFRNPLPQKWLLETGDEELIEGNTWGDTYWGICRGVGENHLGKLLMNLRGQLREYDTYKRQLP